MKEEARDYLEQGTLKDLIKKYSQFINFNIFVWTSKTEEVEEPIPEDEAEKKPEGEEKKDEDKKDEEKKDDEDDAKVEEDKDDKEKKPKTKKVNYLFGCFIGLLFMKQGL